MHGHSGTMDVARSSLEVNNVSFVLSRHDHRLLARRRHHRALMHIYRRGNNSRHSAGGCFGHHVHRLGRVTNVTKHNVSRCRAPILFPLPRSFVSTGANGPLRGGPKC